MNEAPERRTGFSAGTRRLLDRYGETLLRTVAASIEHGLRTGQPLQVTPEAYDEELRSPGACFVTLSASGHLRGCVGSAEAYRPLIEDVAENGFASAFRDSRFPELTAEERYSLRISVSVLSRPEPLRFASESELLGQLRPGRDGLIITAEGRRALFLPQVWESIGEPYEFLAHLKVKAGLSRGHGLPDLGAWRFTAESVSTEALAGHTLWR